MKTINFKLMCSFLYYNIGVINLNFIWTTDLQSTTYQDALTIRKKVFVEEQQVDLSIEIDDLEDQTFHVTGYLNEKAVATARLYPVTATEFKVQRVAVSNTYRGQQLGQQLMKEIERFAKENQKDTLILGAQDQAIGFYEKLGYHTYGEGFLDAGIPHHMMKKELI